MWLRSILVILVVLVLGWLGRFGLVQQIVDPLVAGDYPAAFDLPDGAFKCPFYPVVSGQRIADEVVVADIHRYESRYQLLWQEMTETELAAFIAQMTTAGIRFDVREDRIFIPCKYYSDTNYLWNLTTKTYEKLAVETLKG